jgi:hypothetical protein
MQAAVDPGPDREREQRPAIVSKRFVHDDNLTFEVMEFWVYLKLWTRAGHAELHIREFLCTEW